MLKVQTLQNMHAWTFDHVIDFDNSTIIDKGNNRIRKTLESWHTAKTVEEATINAHSLDDTTFFSTNTNLSAFSIPPNILSTCF